MKTPFLRWILAATAATSLFLGVAHAQVDTSKSTVTATSKQMNVPVDGTFKKFTAQLSFDPAKPAAGSAKLTIDTKSEIVTVPVTLTQQGTTQSFNIGTGEWMDTSVVADEVVIKFHIVAAKK
jgi:polyisoprenoid-binding protein YceI